MVRASVKPTASLIAVILVLAFILILSILAYIEAWNTIRSMEGLTDAMVKAVASCLLVLLSILLVLAAASIALALYFLLQPR